MPVPLKQNDTHLLTPLSKQNTPWVGATEFVNVIGEMADVMPLIK